MNSRQTVNPENIETEIVVVGAGGAGLAAAGSNTGGWESDTYNAMLPGTAFGFAITSGRIAGENAVRYAGKQV